MAGPLLTEALPALLLTNAVGRFVAALWSIGDVAPTAHNIGSEDDSF
jgi:hypothetical protein